MALLAYLLYMTLLIGGSVAGWYIIELRHRLRAARQVIAIQDSIILWLEKPAEQKPEVGDS